MISRSGVRALLRTQSPYEPTCIAGRDIFVKRLDHIDYMGISGNKVYKLLNLLHMDPFPRHVTSMGGCQGNLMLAISKLISFQNAQGDGGYSATYFTRSIPQHLKDKPTGNFATALNLGLKIVELTEDDYMTLSENNSKQHALLEQLCSFGSIPPCWIPLGGAMQEAEFGVSLLADDLIDFILTQNNSQLSGKPWKIITCSGTGITALLLATRMKEEEHKWRNDVQDIEIVAVPCAMPPQKLIEHMTEWVSSSGYSSDDKYTFPTVLKTNCKWIAYGKPNKKLYSMWEYIQNESGISFDLTYAPSSWRQVLYAWEEDNINRKEETSNVIYLHCGGQEGNYSQLQRYKRKWPNIIANEIKQSIK